MGSKHWGQAWHSGFPNLLFFLLSYTFFDTYSRRMARRLRFQRPAATYHVMLRGNNGQQIFFSEEDRVKMCLLLQRGVEQYDHSIEAFCFMSNHIHLAIRVFDTSISRIVHHVAACYAQFINRKYKRVGHLFQGRFKSVLVDDGMYLKELIRYIHLNPVRAGMVSYPQSYSWSSHNAYIGSAEFVWLSRDRVLQRFHHKRKDALQNFERYVLDGIGIEMEIDFKSGCSEGMLGDEEFVEEAFTSAGLKKNRQIELVDLVAKVCEQQGLTQIELCMPGKYPRPSQARALLTVLVREIDEFSVESLAKFLKRDATTLVKAANRLQIKSSWDKTLANCLDDMRSWLKND